MIPSGGRFMVIAQTLMFVFLLYYFDQGQIGKLIKSFRIIAVPFLWLFIIVTIRIGFDYMGLSVLIGNPLQIIIAHDTTPLIDYVKSVL